MTDCTTDSYLVSTSIQRDAFSLEVKASRTSKALEVVALEIRVKGIKDEYIGGYVFDHCIDSEGADRVMAVVEETSNDSDSALLQRLLRITDRHSCGDWRKVESNMSDINGACPALVSFQEFVENPRINAHRYMSVYSANGLSLSAEFEIAAWGEYVSVRIAESSGDFIPEMSDFKVLLPEKKMRTCKEAHQELRRIVTRLAEVFSSLGYAGLVDELDRPDLEVLYHTLLSDCGDRDVKARQKKISSCYRRFLSGIQTEISLAMGKGSAVFEIRSSYDSQNSGITIRFTPGDGFPDFTAAQTRAMKDFYDRIAHGDELPDETGANVIMERLAGTPAVNGHSNACVDPLYQLDPQCEPGELSLSLLNAKATLAMPGLEWFIPREEVSVVTATQSVCVMDRFAITLDLLRDVARGARIIVLRLKPQVTSRRPDLMGFLALTTYCDQRQTVRVISGMGGVQLFTLRQRKGIAGVSPRGDFGKVCRLFARQEESGWRPLISFLTTQGEVDPTADSIMVTPDIEKINALESYEWAGRVLRYALRGVGTELWGSCTNNPDGTASVSVGGKDLQGGVEVRLNGANIEEIVARKRTSDASFMWSDVALFQHSDFVLNDASLFDFITVIRTFFRDQAGAATRGDETATRSALKNLGESLGIRRFACSVSF